MFDKQAAFENYKRCPVDSLKIYAYYSVDNVLDDPDDWNSEKHPFLVVWVEDSDGNDLGLATCHESRGWDCTDPAEYERLEREACWGTGLDWKTLDWHLL